MDGMMSKQMVLGLVVTLPLLALAVPIVMYLTGGWVLRRWEILTSFTDKAIVRYFRTFFQTAYLGSLSAKNSAEVMTKKKSESSESEADETFCADVVKLRRKFDKNFTKAYGCWRFIVPTVLLLLLTGAFCYFWIRLIQSNTGYLKYSQPSGMTVAMAGFAGGYMWILYMLIRRMQERLLNPTDLYWSCFRIIISVPVALAVGKIISESLMVPVAFMLGAFPTTTLITFMRRTAASKLNMQKSFDETETKLSDLQGIDRDQAEVFAREGIGTILQLSYTDPVDLTIRTGFSFSYVVDCCSQALAWLPFEGNQKLLRKYGLRGAQEISTLVYELEGKNSSDPETIRKEKTWAEKTVQKIAEELKMDPLVLRRMFDDIAYDPYTRFLCDVWQPDWN